jgi:hypothetical protein
LRVTNAEQMAKLVLLLAVCLAVHLTEGRPQNGASVNVQGGASQTFSDQDWNQIARGQIQQFQVILRRFAPDTWIQAFEAIPPQTKVCMVKTQTKAIYEASQLSQQLQPEVIMSQVQRNCPDDWDKILSFFQAIKNTFNQLPETFKQAATQLGQKLAGVQDQLSSGNQQVIFPIFAEFLRSLQSLTQQDRDQIANAFPKVHDVIAAPEMNDFLQGTAEIIENENATKSLIKVKNALDALKQRIKQSGGTASVHSDGAQGSFDGSLAASPQQANGDFSIAVQPNSK